MAVTTAAPTFSPVELTLIAAAVNDRIGWLDSEILRLRRQADEADGWSLVYEAEQANRIMRRHYAAIVRRIEQTLDVPYIDEQTARAAVSG